MTVTLRLRPLATGMLVTLAACGTQTGPVEASSAASAHPVESTAVARSVNERALDVLALPYRARPELVAKLVRSPHTYFRALAKPFARAVCRRLEGESLAWPQGRLQGDAHVEQYATSEAGRGLYDFDDASVGPTAIDLVRLATSLRLVARERFANDRDAGNRALDALFEGYGAGLAGAALPERAPAILTRVAARAPHGHAALLATAEEAMKPLDAGDEARALRLLEQYRAALVAKGVDVPRAALEPKRIGRLRSGVGSALAVKLIVRTEGATPAADDDRVVELRELHGLEGVACVRPIEDGVVVERNERLARGSANPTHWPAIALEGEHAWAGEWLDDYEEAEPADVETPDDLAAVARELGIELAREHLHARPELPTAPSAATLALRPDHLDRVRAWSHELEDATLAAHARAQRDAATLTLPPQ